MKFNIFCFLEQATAHAVPVHGHDHAGPGLAVAGHTVPGLGVPSHAVLALVVPVHAVPVHGHHHAGPGLAVAGHTAPVPGLGVPDHAIPVLAVPAHALSPHSGTDSAVIVNEVANVADHSTKIMIEMEKKEMLRASQLLLLMEGISG